MNNLTANRTTSDDQEDFVVTSLPSYRAAVWLWRVCPPVIILFGTFGNVMTIVVLRNPGRGESTAKTPVYFIALAISDLMILCVGLVRHWTKNTFGVDIRSFNDFSCKVQKYFVYLCGLTSAWVLVAMTMQRVTSVIRPHSTGLSFARRRTNVIIAAIIVFSAVFNCHILYTHTVEVQPNSTARSCGVYGDTQYLEIVLFPWLDLVFTSLLPFCLLSFSNMALGRTVVQSVRTARRMGMVSSAHVTSRQRKATSLTVTLIVTSTAFLLLTLPIAVFFILQKNASLDAYDADGDYLAKMELAYTICNLLWYCNAAANFYLYCLSGTKFRQDLESTFRACSRNTSVSLFTLSTGHN